MNARLGGEAPVRLAVDKQVSGKHGNRALRQWEASGFSKAMKHLQAGVVPWLGRTPTNLPPPRLGPASTEIASRPPPPEEPLDAHRGTLKGHRGGLALRPWLPEAQAAAAAARRHQTRASSSQQRARTAGSDGSSTWQRTAPAQGTSDWQVLKARQRGRAEPPPVTEVHLPPSR
jgi:hypothetical protein